MSSEPSIHSNALNFMSFMENGVDTRTGQYTLSIKLPDLRANDFQGPDPELSLNFSPLNKSDSGWGKGWNLSLTQFTAHNQVVTTSTGETFKDTGTAGNRLHLREQLLAHFHLYREPAGPGGNARYRVVHRSGVVEILEEMGGMTGRIALPVQIYSATGHHISLAYQPFNPAYMMLSSITDGSGQILLEVERKDGRIELRERPYQGDDGQPFARYVMNLINTDWVESVVLPTAEHASWRLEYRQVLDHLCLSKVETPTGAREYLLYQDGGHQFPGTSRPLALPRVTRHIIEPGQGQPAFQRAYAYPGLHNFLGFGSGIGWTDDGLDNLYKYSADYEYQTVETLCDADSNPLQSVTRTFNRFHLLTATRTVQNNCVHEINTTYNLRPGSFDDQAPTLQMPIREQTRWSLANDITRSRLETVETQYDTHGNITWRKLASGVTETNTWYGVEAEDGYPGDANGFVRHLKSRTTTPSSDGQGPAPTLTRHYRYRALTPLASDTITLSPMVVEHTETLVQEANPAEVLAQTVSAYIDAPFASLLHGRLYQQTLKRNTLETTTQYQFKRMVDPLSQHPVLETRTTLIGYDGALRSTAERRSLLVGETVFECDENGVQTHWEFDALRRVIRERVSAGTDFEAGRRYAYELCARDGDIARHRVTNARGITTETVLDGLGRPVLEQRDNVHPSRPGSFFKVMALEYDAFGHRVQETVTDWLQGSQFLTLTKRMRYDDWGEQCCSIGPDGVEQHNVLDPIGNAAHKGAIRYTWREGGKLQSRTRTNTRNGVKTQVTHVARAISGKTETWLNLFNKPVRRKRLDAFDELLGERSYTYDGLGHTLSEKDERNHTTLFAYDPWGRMLSTRQANNTQLTRTYAEHSSEELPASLVVTPANVSLPAREIGAQYHDGLDRLVGATTGGRTEYYVFREGESMPRQHITPAGDTIELDYNLQLTNMPTSNNAPEDHARFGYHPTSARLLSSDNGQGKRRYEYNMANQLTAEHWDDVHTGKSWSRTHVSTLHDRLKSTQEANGVPTTHEYYPDGRLKSTLQGQLQAVFEYDELGRVQLITSHDRAGTHSLQTAVEYDDHDRELKRSWRQSGQPDRLQESAWGADDLMLSRTLHVAGVLRLEEGFGYDSHARLVRHTCKGPDLPRDTLGRGIESQVFTFDAFNNIVITITSFTGVLRPERAEFIHAERDPCQLQHIKYTPARAEPAPWFSYDANGNLTRDERNRPVRYDSQNRLLGLNAAGQPDTYGYDGNGLLVSRHDAGKRTLLLHDGERLRLAVRDGVQTLYLHHGEQPLGVQQSGSGAHSPLLLHTSASHSVIAESQAGSTRAIRYTAYGEGHSDDPALAALGYNGEALDPDSGWYLLGNGYRAYNTVLMRFHSPDSLSPFGEGGLNYYGYCLGNPVTFRDPTGHFSTGYSGTSQSRQELERHRISPRVELGVMGWVGMGVGFIFAAIASVVAIVVTYGTATPAVAAAWTAATGGVAASAGAAAAGAGTAAAAAAAGASAAAAAVAAGGGTGAAAAAAAGAALTVSVAAGGGAFIVGTQVAAAIITATLTVAGTAVQTEGVLSGHETRSNIGLILNIAAGVTGAIAGGMLWLGAPKSRAGSYKSNNFAEYAVSPYFVFKPRPRHIPKAIFRPTSKPGKAGPSKLRSNMHLPGASPRD